VKTRQERTIAAVELTAKLSLGVKAAPSWRDAGTAAIRGALQDHLQRGVEVVKFPFACHFSQRYRTLAKYKGEGPLRHVGPLPFWNDKVADPGNARAFIEEAGIPHSE
jgi:hypothetical protein